MELTYEETLQLGNSKEHLKVVLGNLRIANEELSKTLELTKQANIALDRAYQDRDIVVRVSTETWNKITTKAVELDNLEKSLIVREEKIVNKENKFEVEISIAENKLKNLEEQSNLLTNKYLKVVGELKSTITEYQTDIALLKIELEELNEETKKKYLIKKDGENEIIRLSDQKESLEKEISKLTKDFQDKLLEVVRLIEEEKAKIVLPRELLKREQDKLEITKKDLAILRNRLQIQFQQQNPDKILPIELQDK